LRPLPRRLPDRRARPRLHDGPAPLPLVPNDRAPERDPGRAAPASRQLDLRLRSLPGGVPVERGGARRRRRRGAGAAPALAARAGRGGLSRALREDGGGAREAARPPPQRRGGARQQREHRRRARPRRRARRSRAPGAWARGVGARAPRRRGGAARPRGGARERDGRRRGGGDRGGAGPVLTPLARDDGALFGVHLVADARALAQVAHARGAALGEVLLVGLRGDVVVGLPVADLHAEELLDQVDVVHPDGVVVGQERAHLDADVAADALLEAVLDRRLAAAGQRARRQVLDARDRAELRALAARPAEVHVHEGDLARPLLLLADLVGRVGDALLLQAALDDVDGGRHGRGGTRAR